MPHEGLERAPREPQAPLDSLPHVERQRDWELRGDADQIDLKFSLQSHERLFNHLDMTSELLAPTEAAHFYVHLTKRSVLCSTSTIFADRIDSRFWLPERSRLPHVNCYPAAEESAGWWRRWRGD